MRIRSCIMVLLSITAAVLALSWSGFSSVAKGQSDSPSSTFQANANSLGAIPDGGAACGPTIITPLDVTFTVSGVAGAPASVAVSVTFGQPNHTFMGDITATLIAPNNTQFVLFGRTGATTATGTGDGTDLGGTYIFSDNAPSPPAGGWWQDANLRTAVELMDSGTYRTTGIGGAGQVNPAPPTNLSAAFSGVSNANGTWILRITDGCSGDTGSVTAASLTLNSAAPGQQHVTDFNGDGKTDFSVARAFGPNIVWYTWDGVQPLPNGFTATNFGLIATDTLVAEDFDGDNKSDVTVWRPGPAGSAYFYILQSTDGTLRSENFGQTGDDPAVVGDYDGDGKADVAVYRCPPNTGSPGQCYFFYRGSLNNPSGIITYVPFGFGVQGDFFPYIGDFDGDGKNDFCVQRSLPGSPANGQFVLVKSSNNQAEFINWGLSSDFLIPGDYDGDGRTDICVRRSNYPSAGYRTYFVLTRTGSTIFTQWGLTGDSSVPGDYDGDGKTDFAVWRPSTTAGQSAFYVLQSSNGSLRAVAFGQCPSAGTCDYAVAGWPVH